MTRSPHHIRNRLITGCALLLSAIGPASAQGAAGPPTGEILTSGSPDKIDLRPFNKSLHEWRAGEQERLRKEGRATAEEFRKIDAQVIEKAREAEIHRARALEELTKNVNASAIERARAAKDLGNERLDEILEKGGKIEIKQGSGGTEPVKGRGTLGDIDTDSFDPKDFDRVEKELKRREIPYTKKGDALTIDTLDVTIHRKSAGETILETGKRPVSDPPTEAAVKEDGASTAESPKAKKRLVLDPPPKTASSEKLGSSGYSAETARGDNPETAMGLGRKDPAISVADNLKKGAHTFEKPLHGLGPDPPKPDVLASEIQKLGKMTLRNIDETAKVGATGKQVAEIDRITRAQAEQLKAGYSPEAAGIVRDNATAEQRAADIADFQRRAKTAAIDAVRAGDAHIAGELDRLAGEVRHANDVLRAVEATGDPSRIAKAKSAVLEADKALLGYIDLRDAAHNAAILNDPDAAKIYAEARGVKPEGKSPSEIREEIVAGDRNAVADAVAEPTKSPVPGETPKTSGTAEVAKSPTLGEAVKPSTSGEPPKSPNTAEVPKSPTPGETAKATPTAEPTKSAAPGEAPKTAGTPEVPKPPSAGDAVKGPVVAETPKAPGPIDAPKPGRGPISAEPSPMPHAPTAPPEGPGLAGKLSSGLFKGANIALGAVMIYEGVKRGAEEAGKDAAEHGDGMVKSTAKTIGYSAWYGLGVGGAVEAVGKAGGESMEQYKKDIKEGRVDPKSFGSFVWSQVRAVGWGLADLTGTQAIKDAAVEGAGLYSDRSVAAKAEKAAEDAEKAAADKAAKAAIEKAIGSAGSAAGAAAGGTGVTGAPSSKPSGGAETTTAVGPGSAAAPPQTPMPPQAPAPTGSPAVSKTTAPDTPTVGATTNPPSTSPAKQAGTQPPNPATGPPAPTTSPAPTAPTAPPIGVLGGLPSALPSKQAGTLPPVTPSGSPLPGTPTVGATAGLPSTLPSKQAGTLPSGRPSGSPPTGAPPTPPIGEIPAPPPQATHQPADPSQTAQQPATPPKPTTTEVDGGWMTNEDGRSKVVYVNDADGNRIGGYVIHYDKNGKEIGRASWDEKPPEPPEGGAGADGSYGGPITFHARPAKEVTGTLTLEVRGGKVKGVLTAKYQKPWPATVRAEIVGTMSSDFAVTATIRGTSRHLVNDGTGGAKAGYTDYPFLGVDRFTGQLVDGGARGRFVADGQRHDSYTVLGKPTVRCATDRAECAGWVEGAWSIPRTRPMSRVPQPRRERRLTLRMRRLVRQRRPRCDLVETRSGCEE